MTRWVRYADFERGLSGLGQWNLMCDGLENGWFETKARSSPPQTGVALFDQAANPTPTWWKDWLDASVPPSEVPAAWSEWLLNEIEVNWDQVLTLVDRLAREQRQGNAARAAASKTREALAREIRDVLSPAAGSVSQSDQVTPTDRAGPGRPSSMHIIKPMMERRAEAGQLAPTLAGEAAELLRLFVGCPAYAELRRPKITTIRNQIRARYRQLREGTK